MKFLWNKFLIICVFCVLLTGMYGCTRKEVVVPEVYLWTDADIYEAEDGHLLGNACVKSDMQGYSGKGYVEGLTDEGDGITFKVMISEEGFYDFNFVSASSGAGYKENYVIVDGQNLGTVSVESEEFTNSLLERVYLIAGEHEVTLQKYWGWISVDKLEVKKSDEIDPALYEVKRTLCNPNATDNTKRLYSYLCDMYGDYIISGQYCSGMYGLENVAVYNTTGHYPAILGLDFMDYTPSRVDRGTVGTATDSAIGYWNQGGIVTFCWHWNAPEKFLLDPWYSGFYTEYSTIDLAKIMNGEDEEGYNLLMKDIDAIAAQLKILQDNDVPVLWRPLHEASGGWFWWGASGPDAYKELYILLYNKLTNEYKLNNLIWVWNGQDKSWYPGDEYVDIIGWDIYPGEHIYTPGTDTFLKAAECSEENKMIVMSENGCVFDPALAFRDGSTWGFFCTWQGEFVLQDENSNTYTERYTEIEMLRRMYDDGRVITREEIPDLTTYPIKE